MARSGRVSHGTGREANKSPKVLKPKQHVPRTFEPNATTDKLLARGNHEHMHSHHGSHAHSHHHTHPHH